METLRRFVLLAVAGLGLVLGAGGCSDTLTEINENPNSPSSTPEDLQLSALEANFSYEIIGNEAARTTSQWVQQTAFNGVPPSEDNYDLQQDDVDNLWKYFSYIDVMKNARVMNSQAEANGNNAYAGIAKTLLAWNLSVLTDLWGQVPYAEAFDINNTTPAYQEQQVVYDSLFAILDRAQEDFTQQSVSTPGADDLLYGGDMAKWEKLSHTLEARLHMHLTEAPNNSAEERAQRALDALANGFESNLDNANFVYEDAPNARNPWHQFAIKGEWDTRNQLSAHYVNLLKRRGDPRLFVQARQAGAVDGNGVVDTFTAEAVTVEDFALEDSTYVGHQNGTEGIGATSVSSIGQFYSSPAAELNWFNYAEAKFIEAEATLILEGAGAADPAYREGIRASMDQLGIAPDEAEAYIEDRPPLAEEADPLEAIIVEKYIANFLHFEPYNDWRRRGYPELEPAANPLTPNGEIPLRYPYPASELNNNAESIPSDIPVGYEALTIPVWWDTTVE